MNMEDSKFVKQVVWWAVLIWMIVASYFMLRAARWFFLGDF